MGKAYSIRGGSALSALEAAREFSEKVMVRFGRQTRVVTVRKRDNEFECIVDVCGKPNMAIAELAKDVGAW